MAIVSTEDEFDYESLVTEWHNAEKAGEKYPVPFEIAWEMAGFSSQRNARRALSNYLDEGTDFCSQKSQTPSGGRPSDLIRLTCDGAKQLCLQARTTEGRVVRKYFIDVEKKWRAVQEIAPQVAAKAEAQVISEQERILDKQIRAGELTVRSKELDHAMLTMHGPGVLLALRGMEDQIVEIERPVVEVVEIHGNGDRRSTKVLSAKNVVQRIEDITGIRVKSQAQVIRWLETNGYGDLVTHLRRSIHRAAIEPQHIEKVARLFAQGQRQKLLGG